MQKNKVATIKSFSNTVERRIISKIGETQLMLEALLLLQTSYYLEMDKMRKLTLLRKGKGSKIYLATR